MPRRLREHVLVQVVLDHLRYATHQAEQLLHLLGVARVHQLQRPHLAGRGERQRRRLAGGDDEVRIARVANRFERSKTFCFGSLKADARRAHVSHARLEAGRRAPRLGGRLLARLAAHASPREPNELAPLHRARPLALRPGFVLERREEPPEKRLEVAPAQALVPVRADGEPDDDVRVRELVRAARDVLAHERHRQQTPRARHARAAAALEQRDVRGLEQAVAHAVDLREHVREQRADPVASQVDHLERLVLRLALDHCARLAHVARARQVRAHVVLGDAARRAARAKPQLGPLGEQRRQGLAVPLAVEQNDVRLRLHALRFRRLLDTRRDFLQNLSRFVGPSRLLRGGARRSVGRAEHSVEDEKRELPAQPVAGARFRKVERHASAQRPVQLGT